MSDMTRRFEVIMTSFSSDKRNGQGVCFVYVFNTVVFCHGSVLIFWEALSPHSNFRRT